MKHIRALLIKLVFIEALTLAILLPAARVSTGQALAVGLVSTALLYLTGDLIILPLLGNLAATIADFGLATLIVWFSPLYTGARSVTLGTALMLAAAIGVAEYFFHRYLRQNVLPGSPAPTPS